ncbi:MAG: Ppx/GppA family phosphatase [Alphaproteobacteria bacterium]|nr:Ppx/GppA family phosphatase [Alphaproteobacteria bacterium]
MNNHKTKVRGPLGPQAGKRRRAPRKKSGAAEPDGIGAYAALDLGTNNCRLLVATPEGDSFRVVDAFSRIVRLGEGLEKTGRLTDAAMDRTISALRVCASKMARKKVVRARNVATEACRRAANCAEFLGRIQEETGLEFEIITPYEEARLALSGCIPLLVEGYPYGIVFDIGGGSTEVMWVEIPGDGSVDVIETLSIPLGVVNLAEIHGGGEITEAQFETMVRVIAGELSDFETRNGITEAIGDGRVQMLGTSGTVTTLAGIHMGLPAYDRSVVDGCFLGFKEVATVTRHLMGLDFDGRAGEPCVGVLRADLVVAGCAILEAICRTWDVGRLRVADRGVREGILLGLMRLAARPGTAEA